MLRDILHPLTSVIREAISLKSRSEESIIRRLHEAKVYRNFHTHVREFFVVQALGCLKYGYGVKDLVVSSIGPGARKTATLSSERFLEISPQTKT